MVLVVLAQIDEHGECTILFGSATKDVFLAIGTNCRAGKHGSGHMDQRNGSVVNR